MKSTQTPRKSSRKLLAIIALLLSVLLAADLLGANYLVSFAIGRTTSGGASVAPEPITTDDTRKTVDENWERIAAETDQWLTTVSPETIVRSSYDGLELTADVYAVNPDSSRWAILVHGYTANRHMMEEYACMYAKHGYNLLLPDLKGHGDSQGDYIGMGWPDRIDMLGWIDTVRSRCPEAEIVLHGVSMGGATVLMTSGEDLPENVKAIVDDCGYTSVWDIFSDEMKVLFHLPDFPLLHTASIIARYRAGYDFREASAIKQVAAARVPILFIHGAEDNFVHTDMVYRLYDACPTRKDIMVVDSAGHGESFYYVPQAYEQKVFGFLDDIL